MENSIQSQLEEIKVEDYQDGITAEEKANLAKDLLVVNNVLQTHDSSIFQLIANANALQNLLVEKLGISEEDLQNAIKGELETLQEKFLQKVSEAENS